MIPYETSTIESGYYIGTVMDTDRSTREIQVYIPKLMPIIDSADNLTYKTKSYNFELTLNGTSAVDNEVVMRKTIIARAEDKEESMPAKDSKVIVYFIDNNPNLAFWRKFNVYGVDYEKDQEDRLVKEKLFTISFIKNNDVLNSIDIHKNDNISIEIPDNLSINIDKKDSENIKIRLGLG